MKYRDSTDDFQNGGKITSLIILGGGNSQLSGVKLIPHAISSKFFIQSPIYESFTSVSFRSSALLFNFISQTNIFLLRRIVVQIHSPDVLRNDRVCFLSTQQFVLVRRNCLGRIPLGGRGKWKFLFVIDHFEPKRVSRKRERERETIMRDVSSGKINRTPSTPL